MIYDQWPVMWQLMWLLAPVYRDWVKWMLPDVKFLLWVANAAHELFIFNISEDIIRICVMGILVFE